MPTIGRFDLLDAKLLPEARAPAYRLVHRGCGARWLHLRTPNEGDHLFSVTLPTPPADSTGVAHVLERCVFAAADRDGVPLARGLSGVGADTTFYRVGAQSPRDLLCPVPR